MTNLYLVINDEGICLANMTGNNARDLAAQGWRVLCLGLAYPDVMPGVLANVSSLDRRFAQNTSNLVVNATKKADT